MPTLPKNPTTLDIVEWFLQLPLARQKTVIDTMQEIDEQSFDAMVRRGEAERQPRANPPEGGHLDNKTKSP